MRPIIMLCIAMITAYAASAQAQSPDLSDKLCVNAAARQLPIIQGLVVTASRTKHAGPKESDTKVVEIDVRVAGQDTTYGFACAFGDRLAVAIPLGIVK